MTVLYRAPCLAKYLETAKDHPEYIMHHLNAEKILYKMRELEKTLPPGLSTKLDWKREQKRLFWRIAKKWYKIFKKSYVMVSINRLGTTNRKKKCKIF